MAYKVQRKIYIGKKAKHTFFGKIGCSHVANWGGFDNFIYGVKGIFNLQVYKGWGECAITKLQ